MRVLLVEDDAALSANLLRALSTAGYAVDLAEEGVHAEFLGRTEPYDAVVLDLGLPKRDGLTVLADWRRGGVTTPIIILTARDSWQERVDGLKAGADDYLGKPFHTEELLARLQALIRRAHDRASPHLSAAGLTLDEEHQTVVTGDGTVLSLTGTEFRLLRYFMHHPGRVLSKSRLTEHVYEQEADKESNVIEVYVNRLRQKLGRDLIQTRRGQGYIFAGDGA